MSLAIAPPGPQVDDQQRLGATLVLSLLLHGMLVLGIGFSLDDAAPVTPTLDVILTETTSPLTQAQADFLAQASNQGGGEHEESLRPRESQLGLAPQDQTGIAPEPLRAPSPDAQPPPPARPAAPAARARPRGRGGRTPHRPAAGRRCGRRSAARPVHRRGPCSSAPR